MTSSQPDAGTGGGGRGQGDGERSGCPGREKTGDRGRDRAGAPRWIAGVDIGGTNLRVGLVPLEGGPPGVIRRERTRAGQGPAHVAAKVADMLRSAVGEVGRGGVAGIGVGCPGPVDRGAGMVLETPNLGWRHVPLRDLVADATGLPVTLENDANCAAYGEWWQGAGRGAERLIGLTLGTGIGGGIVLGGEIYHGASDAAGEVGHMSVDFDGRLCACGSRGCVEAYASGPGIAARAVEGLADAADSSLAGIARTDGVRVTARMVCEAAGGGDGYARRVLAETGRILAVAVANLVNLFNPDVIVVAGGVTAAGDHLFRPLRDEVRRRAFPSALGACRVVPAALPGTAGVIGAAGVFKGAVYGGV